jgi:ornithine decarboxylase
MSIGDLVVGHQMGAYTSATATDFNLFKRAKIVVINQKPSDKAAENTVAFI